MAGKKPIPGSYFLISGVAMILMSVFIDVNKLMFFILVGAIFVVIGFIKEIMRKGEEKSGHKRPASHHTSPGAHTHHKPGEHPTHPHTTHQTKKTEHGTHTTSVRCASCGVKLHPQFKYCPNCGQKLS